MGYGTPRGGSNIFSSIDFRPGSTGEDFFKPSQQMPAIMVDSIDMEDITKE